VKSLRKIALAAWMPVASAAVMPYDERGSHDAAASPIAAQPSPVTRSRREPLASTQSADVT
jgi:hypothetical protein